MLVQAVANKLASQIWIIDKLTYAKFHGAKKTVSDTVRNFIASAALATALLVPMAAQAVTVVTNNGSFTETAVLFPDQDVSLNFEAAQDLRIADFSVSGLGSAADLGEITFQVISQGTVVEAGEFDTITPIPLGGFSVGTSALASLILNSGDLLTVTFFDGIENSASVSAILDTTPVPLPAAGGMLLSGLFAAGFVARRKKKKAA